MASGAKPRVQSGLNIVAQASLKESNHSTAKGQALAMAFFQIGEDSRYSDVQAAVLQEIQANWILLQCLTNLKTKYAVGLLSSSLRQCIL